MQVYRHAFSESLPMSTGSPSHWFWLSPRHLSSDWLLMWTADSFFVCTGRRLWLDRVTSFTSQKLLHPGRPKGINYRLYIRDRRKLLVVKLFRPFLALCGVPWNKWRCYCYRCLAVNRVATMTISKVYNRTAD